jgi:Putative zinc-finger
MTADDRRAGPPLPPPAHPDLDTLADLHADALDPSTADRVRAHVSSCPRCGPVLAALDGVRDELRALPVPPVPASVAARLDATLADLRRTDLPASRQPVPVAGAGPRVAHPDRTDELGPARERRQRRLGRSLGAVAAAVAVIAAGASVTALVRSSTSNNDSATSAGSAAGAPVLPAPAAGSATPLGTDEQAPTVAIPSYDKNTLRIALPSIVQRSAVEIITGEGDTGPAGVMADTARRTACAGTIPGGRGEPRAVLRIRYENRPAYVFVFESGGARTGVVVPDDCGENPVVPAAVLGTVS